MWAPSPRRPRKRCNPSVALSTPSTARFQPRIAWGKGWVPRRRYVRRPRSAPDAWPVARSSCSPRCCSAAAVAGAPAAATAAGDCVPAASWPADRADLAAQVVTLVNAHRAQLGLVPLVVSPTLTAAAEWKARNMAAYDYLDHDDPAPDARTANERVLACGYPATFWGENIGDWLRHRRGRGRRLAGVPRAPGEHRPSSSTALPASASRARRRCTGRSPSAPWPTRAAWPPRPRR